MFKTSLIKAVRRCADGVGIDVHKEGVLLDCVVNWTPDEVIFDVSGETLQVYAPEQEIEVDSAGMATIKDTDGNEHEIELEVVERYALREDHLK